MRNKGNGIFTRRTVSNIIVLVVGVVVYLALSNFGGIQKSISSVFRILSPFINGMVIAFLLNMPMRFFEEKIFNKVRAKRALSILCVYVLALLLVGVLVGMILPQVWDSVITLTQNIEYYLKNLDNFAEWISGLIGMQPEYIENMLISYGYGDLLATVTKFVVEILPKIPAFTMQLGSGIVGGLTAIIASIYMLGSKEKLLRQIKKVLFAVLPLKRAKSILRVGGLSNRVFSGFIGGKLIDSAIIGFICFIFMWVMDTFVTSMPFALLISVVVGVTNIIPFFGPFIGAIPSVMILLLVNPWSALWFGIFIIVLQQFDGNVLGPKILGESTGLPAIWVLIAIVLGGGLFGFVGMIMGVPTAAVLYTLASDLVARRLEGKNISHDGQPLQSVSHDDNQSEEQKTKPEV